MADETRKTKTGEIVSAIGRADMFHVIKVDDHTRTADIKVIETGSILQHVPWMALSHARNKKDTSK